MLVIFITTVTLLGLINKRGILNILMNNCLTFSDMHYGATVKKTSIDVYKAREKHGFVDPRLTGRGVQLLLFILIVASFKYWIELHVNSKYYK
tara:strand:- start:33 stop:311 length:279 start_codon:yes stop_codon:yes gene_type:complete